VRVDGADLIFVAAVFLPEPSAERDLRRDFVRAGYRGG
jgi:hypothetical protein